MILNAHDHARPDKNRVQGKQRAGRQAGTTTCPKRLAPQEITVSRLFADAPTGVARALPPSRWPIPTTERNNRPHFSWPCP